MRSIDNPVVWEQDTLKSIEAKESYPKKIKRNHGGYVWFSNHTKYHNSESFVEMEIKLLEKDKVGKWHVRTQLLFYTPRYCSWLNQIEIWFGILRSKVTRWLSFPSLEELEQSILRYIEYYNSNFADPFAWTYCSKLLSA